MKYNEMILYKHKAPKRVGRGISAGQGKTAGRGTKGQMSRAGSSKRPGFEGGQNPLMQRLPKLHGFRSYKIPAEVVYTGSLDDFAAKNIDAVVLAQAGLISSEYVSVKLIVKGEITKKVNVKLPSASAGAIAAIHKAGGNFESVPRLMRQASTKKKK